MVDMTLPEIKEYFIHERIKACNGIKLDACSTIIDGALFVENHIHELEMNHKNRLYLPVYERLMKIICILNK